MYRKQAHIHFVGIGGIGMSGIATILRSQGYEVSGCDSDIDQPSIDRLQTLGCSIFQGNNTPFCLEKADVVVYSSAIQSESDELTRARQAGIPTIPRALMLAELMRTKFSVAIAGAHGKTTTTSLVSHILIEADIDPTVVIGGHLKNLSSNARLGNGDFFVAEADESDRSLLRLHPTFAIVTNIDLEHLETYADIDDIKQTFHLFLSNLPFYGKAFVCREDPHLQSILPIEHVKTVSYGLTPLADLYASEIKLEPNRSIFHVKTPKAPQSLGSVILHMPGKHNVLNCLAAIALSLDLGIPFEKIASAIETFKGVERRFSFNGTYRDAEIFDDYGHHPHELACTFEVAKKRAQGKLIVIFQPHRYTRTAGLWNEFLHVLLSSSLDTLIITDIYAASEPPLTGITSEAFYQALLARNPSFPIFYTRYDADFNAIKNTLDGLIAPKDLVLLQGAGKINKLGPALVSRKP